MARIEIDLLSYPVRDVINELLLDRTTNENIIFATDSYAERGEAWGAKKPITKELLWSDRPCAIQPRALKNSDERLQRTKKRAEVFTPAWVCRMMNDFLDEDFFGRKDVFFRADGNAYRPTEGAISFPEGVNWQTYVDSRRLEITCGEAPYLVSRYDSETGEVIPTGERVGLLDRKMRVVNENAATQEEWLKWTARAFQAVYGYEYQGDNLLIARINLFLSFTEYLEDRWSRQATDAELKEIARTVSRNLWQMDGLRGTIPMGALFEPVRQLSMFDLFEPPKEEPKPCAVYDWRAKKTVPYYAFKEGGNGSMKFDYIIGNPPYQEETESDSTRMPPIYHLFMDESFSIASKVELITPARFLFNAGYTPKNWNEKMLNDEHFQVLYYESESSKIFMNTDIKGGIAVSYRDSEKFFKPIEVFTKYSELNTILKKVKEKSYSYLDEIISSPLSYKLSQLMLDENPDTVGRLRTSAFSKLSSFFYECVPDDSHKYIGMIGLLDGKRTKRYIREDYIVDSSDTLNYYTLLVAKANGAGLFGETLSDFFVAEPGIGFTQTFIGIGKFNTKQEVDNLGKYIKGKFARAMLGVLKITQDCPGPKWKYVPLQDFTPVSDIDWSQSVSDIDRQLYKKYGLSPEEIAFIESHVKEME
ncbi:MAG: Eco57I restriction-modification methylase domain-containing protein [Clostridia bacterium]|nr:Eco57I restriction-modification methylase domain-containing protein [Clostridia bacterium]